MIRTPLNVLDGCFLNIDRRGEPWSVHLELQFEQRVNPGLLRLAVEHALDKHPIARARLAPHSHQTTTYLWEIPEVVDHLPVTELDAGHDTDLDQIRDRLVSARASLSLSPVLLVYLVHHPDGDRLMVNVNHAVGDGIAAFRLVDSMLRYYAGLPDPGPDFDPLSVRDLKKLAGTHSVREAKDRLKLFTDRLKAARSSPARVQPRGLENNDDHHGYGCVLVPLDAEDTARLMALRTRPATVNDVLMAGMLVTLGRWNRRHGGESGPITALMPVNLRPQEWWSEVVGNFTSYVTVGLSPYNQGDLGRAIQAVQGQTSRLKETGAAGILIDVLEVPRRFPAVLKRRLRDVGPTLGRNLIETTWVSNMGLLGDLPVLPDAGRVKAVFFSPPAPMPMGISVGIASMGAEMFLTFRYHRAKFDRAGAQELAELFVETMLTRDEPQTLTSCSSCSSWVRPA